MMIFSRRDTILPSPFNFATSDSRIYGQLLHEAEEPRFSRLARDGTRYRERRSRRSCRQTRDGPIAIGPAPRATREA